MTTFTVSNIEERADGSVWDYGKVSIAVAGPAYDSDGHSIGGKSDKQTDATGLASFAGLTVGVPYVWTHADGETTYFTAASAGTFTLQAISTGPPAPGPGAVTPDALTARLTGYALKPTGTPDGTKFYRDDGTWAVPAGGGSGVTDTGWGGAVA